MSVRIDSIGLGITQCYLLRGEGTILVDAGTTGQTGRFQHALERLSVDPHEIRLIVLTHAHGDHTGSVKNISALTGAPVAVHSAEHAWLEQGRSPLPPGITGWGRALVRLMALAGDPMRYAPAGAGVVLTDAGLSLAEYGIAGSIVYTPGHTRGSVSVVLDSGDAMVGDLAMAGLPLRLSPGLPVLAEDWALVLESWRMLLARGVTIVYPAHGKPFPAEVIRQAMLAAA
jgi:hydroxyacylglutathione hydrolase